MGAALPEAAALAAVPGAVASAVLLAAAALAAVPEAAASAEALSAAALVGAEPAHFLTLRVILRRCFSYDLGNKRIRSVMPHETQPR